MNIGKKQLTLICVAIAGTFFVIAFYINNPWLAIIGAFFDWLPLPTGWMRFTKASKIPLLHIVLTLISYGFFIGWFFLPFLRVPFLIVWIWAVLAGADIS